ncbi:MAG: hypothetical protein HRT68_02445 [Flavobacteriaceae bacterium]|nr:hypothetical protein [Flavobacteriaceae bacterium]
MNKIICLLILIVCSSYNTDEAQYFEGIIVYDLSYESIHPKGTPEMFEQIGGVKEVFYYKEGYYKRVALNKDGQIIKTIIHDPIKKMIYGTHSSFGDTITAYSSEDNIMKSYKTKKLTKELVLDQEVQGYHYSYKVEEEYSQSGKFSYDFYYSKDLLVNPEHHQYQKEGFYNEIVKEHPYLSLKMIINDYFFKKQTKTAVEVKKQKLPLDIFKIDETKPIKKI